MDILAFGEEEWGERVRGSEGRESSGGRKWTRGVVLFVVFGDLFSRLVLWFYCMVSVNSWVLALSGVNFIKEIISLPTPFDFDARIVFRSADCQIFYNPVSKFRTTLHRIHHEYFNSQRRSEKRDWAIANKEKKLRFHHLQRGYRRCCR